MSSMVARLLLSASMLTLGGSPITPEQAAPAQQMVQASTAAVPPLAPAQKAMLQTAFLEWKSLQQSDNYDFSRYAAFMIAHPGWPGETRMQRVAEGRIDPNYADASQVTAFFNSFPPLTNTGWARYAIALQAIGDRAAAANAARQAWTGGVLNPQDEAQISSVFQSVLTQADQDKRMDELLWQGQTSAAQRQLALTSPAKRALYAARLAMRMKASDAGAQMAAVDNLGRSDANYIADKARWLRDTGNSLEARQLLAGSRQITTRPVEVEDWYEILLTNAKAAANDHQYALAYNIARQVDDAYPIATDVSNQTLGERDDYTSLVWLAGSTALQDLKRPADAIGMFERYARAARSPQTRSKGFYWAGRAAQAAGQQAQANGYLEQAATFADQFYGQLALERLGRPIPAPQRTPPAMITAAERQAFYNNPLIQTARLLGEQGDHRDQTDFLRAIAAQSESDAEHALAIELARYINRPDLGVMIGRLARRDGSSEYSAAAYPTASVPSSEQDNWTMIHAIARQESQFDRAATSHAGARGLMQLMPATARETAGKIGLPYTPSALTDDPGYNMRLGSFYFSRMMDYYGGSYPLAVAAYNAGPGNVNKWLAANGDPRMPGVDIVTWIEDIPIYETKNYVQRVLENAVVYGLSNPGHAHFPNSPTPLSRYLGKNQPG